MSTRSTPPAELTSAPRPALPLLLGAFFLLATASGCARTLYNFGEVREGALYRSAQPSPLFLRYVARTHGVRTLVNLRGKTPGYESAFAARHGLRLFVFNLSSSRPPSDDEVARFLRIVGNPENHPVLVHCRNGVDRSGYMVGIYRTERDGWTADQATREMNRFLQFEWPNPVPQRVVRDGLRGP